MAYFKKKSELNSDIVSETEAPVKRNTVKIGKRQNPEPELVTEAAAEDVVVEEAEDDPVATPRIRLSVDLLKDSYVQLKCYSVLTNETIVSILTRLIDKHCSVKVSL